MNDCHLVISSCSTHREDQDHTERCDTCERQGEPNTLDPDLGCKLCTDIGHEAGEDLDQEHIDNMQSGVWSGDEQLGFKCLFIPGIDINLLSDHLYYLVVMFIERFLKKVCKIISCSDGFSDVGEVDHGAEEDSNLEWDDNGVGGISAASVLNHPLLHLP